MDRQPPTNPGVDSQKKNAPADVAASREQVSSGKPSTSKKMKRSEAKVNELRAVASGELNAAGRVFGVDVLSNGEHVFRFGNVSEVFGVAADDRHFERRTSRILADSQDKTLRPVAFSIPGGGRANGITSVQFVGLLRAFIQRGMDGKLKGKQAQALAGAWAVASALMAEGVDSMIDAALGIARTPKEAMDRAAAHFERELGEARLQIVAASARAERAERELAAVAESSELARARVTELEQLLKDLEILSMRDGTVGQEWAEGNVSAIIERAVALRLGTDKRRASQIRKSITNRVRNNLGFTRAGSKWSHYPTNPAAVSQLKQELEKELRDAYAARSAFNRSQKRKDGDEVQREFFFAVFGFGGAR